MLFFLFISKHLTCVIFDWPLIRLSVNISGYTQDIFSTQGPVVYEAGPFIYIRNATFPFPGRKRDAPARPADRKTACSRGVRLGEGAVRGGCGPHAEILEDYKGLQDAKCIFLGFWRHLPPHF